MKYSEKLVQALWHACGLPPAVAEHSFCAGRKWRFDFAWPRQRVAVEVQGGIWIRGRHTRGAALKQEWEKLNTAAILGWRVLYCEPSAVMSPRFAETIRAALTRK